MPSVNLSQETYEKLKKLAERRHSSLGDAVEKALDAEAAEQAKLDARWRQEWDDLVATIRSRVPRDRTAEEIDADIDATVAKVRAERRARSR